MSSEENHIKAGSTAGLRQKLHKEKTPEEIKAELLEHPSYVELQTKLTEAEEKVNQYWERILRMQAEYDNKSRQAERDIANAHKYANKELVLEVILVIDGLERAIAAHPEEAELFDGVKLTLKMFYNLLNKFNIQQVNPEGQPFNPEWHQAVSIQEDPHVPPGTVLNVLQKGYLLNDRLLRPAMVIVSK